MPQGGGRFDFNTPERVSDASMENQELMKQNEALRSEMEAIMKRLDELEAPCVGEVRQVWNNPAV